MTTFFRIINSGWKSLRRQQGLSLATIFIMILTISLITSLFLLQRTSNFLVASLEEKVDMAVYLIDEASEKDILDIQEELGSLSEIKNIEYVSKEEALRRFTERHEGDVVIMESLEEVGANPLSPSINIKAWEASQYAAISVFLETASFHDLIAKVDYTEKKPAIDKLFSLTSSINTTGIVFGIILALVAVLISFNTVRIAIYNAREEIETMRLVGASNWFIRGPFLVQGIVVGILAVLISFVFFSVAVWLLGPKIEVIVPGLGLSSYFFSNFLIVLLIQMVTAVGLGVFSSWVAVRKYLKV